MLWSSCSVVQTNSCQHIWRTTTSVSSQASFCTFCGPRHAYPGPVLSPRRAAALVGCSATSWHAAPGNGTVGMQGPDAHTGAVQEWDATPAALFCACRCATQASVCMLRVPPSAGYHHSACTGSANRSGQCSSNYRTYLPRLNVLQGVVVVGTVMLT